METYARYSILALVMCANAATQVVWEKNAGTEPSARAGHAMTPDGTGGLILFGGLTTNNVDSRDTWRWFGNAWRRLTLTVSPSARHTHAMAFDSKRKQIVLFGGNSGGVQRSDTWIWNGGAWRQVRPTVFPPARARHAMAYDVERGVVVLFGGVQGSLSTPKLLNDVWEFDGATWRQITPLSSPTPRRDAAMAYYPPTQRIVMFGGLGIRSNQSDTWTWDGAIWVQQKPSVSPSPRHGAPLAYYPARGCLVMFGGWGNSAQNDTWEYDPRTWHRRSHRGAISVRSHQAIAYDATSERVLLHGGWRTAPIRGTWSYRRLEHAIFGSFGVGCRGSNNRVPSLAAANGTMPWIGSIFQVGFASMPATGVVLAALDPQRKSVDLTRVGMPGCRLYASPTIGFPLLNAAGRARLLLSIPDAVSLVGVNFALQGIVQDRAANAVGLTLTNGGDVRIGAR